MRYWDASAIVPLIIAETHSEQVRTWLREDDAMVTWAWTRVELVGAVERRTREGLLSREHRRTVLAHFSELADAWDEVLDLVAVRKRALPLLARHALRAADAAQLAAALLVAEDDPESLSFVCLDQRLAIAAEGEGFPVLTADDSDSS